MTTLLIIAVTLGGLLLGGVVGSLLPSNGHLRFRERPQAVRRILLPFTSQAISRRAFDATVRLAKAENATIIPAFLARVPRHLPLDSALPVQCGNGMPLLEALEQSALRQGVSVDARVARGRTYRDALCHILDQEQFDRVIVSATDSPERGLTPDDLEWLLRHVPAEVLILRPAPEDNRTIETEGIRGHF